MNKLAIKMIKKYQKNTTHSPKRCRFMPTCSQYAIGVYENFNFFYASYLTAKRIIRCNPLTKPKYDPIPQRIDQMANLF